MLKLVLVDENGTAYFVVNVTKNEEQVRDDVILLSDYDSIMSDVVAIYNQIEKRKG